MNVYLINAMEFEVESKGVKVEISYTKEPFLDGRAVGTIHYKLKNWSEFYELMNKFRMGVYEIP